MSAAICIRCGAQKRGAYSQCLRCGFDPERSTPEDRVKSVLLSEENLDLTGLQAVSQEIKAGHTPAFDAEQITVLTREMQSRHAPRARPRRGLKFYACLAISIFGVTGWLWLILH